MGTLVVYKHENYFLLPSDLEMTHPKHYILGLHCFVLDSVHLVVATRFITKHSLIMCFNSANDQCDDVCRLHLDYFDAFQDGCDFDTVTFRSEDYDAREQMN